MNEGVVDVVVVVSAGVVASHIISTSPGGHRDISCDSVACKLSVTFQVSAFLATN